MTSIQIGSAALTVDKLVVVARGNAAVVLDDTAAHFIQAGNALLHRLVEAGTAIYGVTTGLGAAVDTAIAADDSAVQARIPLGRAVGVGRLARRDEVRAIICARLAGLALGRSGISMPVVEALAALLNREIYPEIPMLGSIGESDLAPLAHVALTLIGVGQVEYRGERKPAAQAMREAGIALPVMNGKDGLALVSANAASVGIGALAIADAQNGLQAMLAAAALSHEAYRANLSPLDPSAASIRPAPGQAEAASQLLDLLSGSDLTQPGAARHLQDPLSFRCTASVSGAALHRWQAAREAVEMELSSADDNPALLFEHGAILPNANFDATHLALAFEALGLAMSRVAACSAERIMKLMSPASSGLPRFLTSLPGRTGFATLQKTVSLLVSQISHLANPMPAVTIAVADRVEDYASQAMSIVEKTAGIVEHLRLLATIELIVAAQAVDLRSDIRLGHGTRKIHLAVRAIVAPLTDDRPASPDILALAAFIQNDGMSSIVSASAEAN